jgi:uncharacterized LabA/DUF88 family protein
MQYQSIVLVDGENLVIRYQSMCLAGRIPREDNHFVEDCFAWNSNITRVHGLKDIVRVAYYTTVVGDDVRLKSVSDQISEAPFRFDTLAGLQWKGTLVPYVYKKGSKSAKTKSVDINLTIDALRYAYGASIDQIVLVSGDGDYIPLLREIMSRGKMVQVWALSDGLHPEIKHHVDDLTILDEMLFQPLPVDAQAAGIPQNLE